ncbi:MAG: hypothetical protein AAF984_10200 [Verrucomicrobiota bacterium]
MTSPAFGIRHASYSVMDGIKPTIVSTKLLLKEDAIPSERKAQEDKSSQLLPATAPWDQILAQEKMLAKQYFARHKGHELAFQDIKSPISNPDSQLKKALVSPSIENKNLNIAENSEKSLASSIKVNDGITFNDLRKLAKSDPIESLLDTKKKPIFSLSEEVPEGVLQRHKLEQMTQVTATKSLDNTSKTNSLPIEDFAARKNLLKQANIDFDAENKTWTATWWKPRMFHFGSILYPSLKDNIPIGATYSFESQGMTRTLTKQGDDIFLKSGESSRKLGARELYSLLRNKISTDGLDLGVDRKGNLIMQAKGAKAVFMANLKH